MGSEGTYPEVSATMASMKLKYRSVKFKCEDKDVKDVDIVRALMVQCDVEEIERVHPMPSNYWVVIHYRRYGGGSTQWIHSERKTDTPS